MKKLASILTVLVFASLAWAGQSREDATDRMNNAAKVMEEIMATPDKGIPEEVLAAAQCVAIVPHMMKGGLGIGAEHGRGVATCRTAHGWSAPAFFSISGGSWGLQIGLEGIDLVMVFTDRQGANQMLSSKFEVGGDASASAGPVGRHAAANTDWKLNTKVLTYSRSKGAFAGLTLNGARIAPDEDSTRAFYGHEVSTDAILTGRVPVPPSARSFIATVSSAKVVSREDEDKEKNDRK
ncbi:MAG: lipid-binding SYLF domain-containing protein [Terriglobales bacterium]